MFLHLKVKIWIPYVSIVLCRASGRKVEDPDLLEGIRLTILNNLLKYHPVCLFFDVFINLAHTILSIAELIVAHMLCLDLLLVIAFGRAS